MKYTAQFDSIDSRTYTIEIITDNSPSPVRNVKLGATPFTTSMKSEGKHIYAPIKTTGATITLLQSDYNFDFYTGQAKGTKVYLKQGDNVEWCGFLTPCCYNQGFDEYYEEVQLEAVDGIAVLKDIPYRTTSEKHTIMTFADIIHRCLRQSGLYKNLYITDNVQLKSNGTDSIIDKFRISQANFFNKKKDVDQTDDDVAWSCYDVLKEIMQYLGYTMFADGENIIVADIDAFKNGNNTYFRYDISSSILLAPQETVELSYSHRITGASYAENGTNISLDDVYNKVSVKDEYYTFDNLFPDFGDRNKETNITNESDQIPSRDGHYMEQDVFTNKNGEPYQIFITKSWKGRMWVMIVQQMESNVFDFIKYSTAASHQKWTLEKVKYSDMLKYHGAFYVRYWKRELKSEEYNKWRVDYPANFGSMSKQQRYDAWLELLNAEPEKLSLSPMIVIVNQDTNRIGPSAFNHTGKYDRVDGITVKEDCQYYPVVTLKGTQQSSIFGGDGSYLIVKGSFRHHDEIDTPYPLADGADNDKLNRDVDYKYGEEGFIWARLKWGGNYWNGDGWGSNPCDFKLRFWKPDRPNKPDCQNKTIYDTDFEFIDTAQSQYGCSERGVYVPCPPDGNLTGTAEFTLYMNRDMWGDSRRSHWHDENRYNRYYSKVVMIKNLQIKAFISNGLLDDEGNDSDTVYTNVINNGSLEKMSDIKFKICTFDNKKPTYSSVDYLDENGKSVYVTKTYNKANAMRESGSISSFDRKTGLTQEEHLIFKLVSQYENPRVIFEANLHNDGHKLYGVYRDATISGSRYFIADTISVDYKANQTKIKLIEKW